MKQPDASLGWTLPDAIILLTKIIEPADEAGYDIAVVGSVAERGQSLNDVNLLVKPLRLTKSSANHATQVLATILTRLGATHIGDDVWLGAEEEGAISRFLTGQGCLITVHYPFADFAH